MGATVHSTIFSATREQVAEMADVCRLRHEHTSRQEDRLGCGRRPDYTGQEYDMWQDSQTGGGGCRLVWMDGIVWVSCHSGYSYADITEEVCDLFRDYMGCVPAKAGWHDNPAMYPDALYRRNQARYAERLTKS